MEQLAVGDIDEPEEARHHMKVPEKIGVDLYILEKLGQKITPKRDPIVCAGRGEIGHEDMGLDNLRMGDPVPLSEKA